MSGRRDEAAPAEEDGDMADGTGLARATAPGAVASKVRWGVFQLHWVLGITLGLVLAVMGVTGAAMAFEDQIMQALSPGVASVQPRRAPLLTPDQLLARF